MAYEDNPYAPPQTPPPPPGSGSQSRLPWEERKTLGFVTAFLETVKLVVTDPKEAYGRLRADGDLISPLIFGLLIAWVMTLIGQMWSLAFSSLLSFGDVEAFGAMAGGGLLQLIFLAVLYPLIHVIVIFIWAGIHHLCLMVLGGLDQSELGFEGTFKILCYAMVAQFANIVPILGAFINLGVTIFLLVMGFQAAHKTSQGKAVVAALIPLVLCCVCFIAMFAIFGAALAAAIGGAAAVQ